MINAFSYGDNKPQHLKPIPVDQWTPDEQDKIFKTCKGALVLPVSKYFNLEEDPSLDRFVLSTKRCYNGDTMHVHLPLYMNYFEKFYDNDRELLITLFRFKYLIDYESNYTKEAFIFDLRRYILSDSLMIKVHMMNEDNYCLELDKKKYRNDKNPCLQYTDRHAKILMFISVVVNMMIPLITHYAYMHKIANVNKFILEVYDIVFDYVKMTTGVNMFNKIGETTSSNISKNAKDNSGLWDMQDIRGESVNIHSSDSVNNIILNIIPKYVYDKNIVFLNYTSIRNSIGYQITDIGFEFDFKPLSGSKRDIDQNSEYDKFESMLIKQNEALYLQNKVNAEKTIEYIEYLYGPFDNKEIEYYIKRLSEDRDSIINGFQKNLIYNLFYKYFGDPVSAYSINKIDYVKLLIAAKNLLLANNMVILPYIISSRVERLQIRKSLNKKEEAAFLAEPIWDSIKNKYRDDKVIKHVLSMYGTILASDFRIIDYYNDEIDGRLIVNIPEMIRKELAYYVLLC